MKWEKIPRFNGNFYDCLLNFIRSERYSSNCKVLKSLGKIEKNHQNQITPSDHISAANLCKILRNEVLALVCFMLHSLSFHYTLLRSTVTVLLRFLRYIITPSKKTITKQVFESVPKNFEMNT